MPWVVDDYGVAQAREYLARSTADWEADESWNYAIFEPNGQLVGSCGLMTRMGPGVLEIGYWVHSDYTGLGYATTAATALAEIGLATQGIDRIAIKTDVANTASGRVAEKAGFTKVGVEHDEPDAPGDSGENIIWERTS
jgi:RimJ/RimL family protein N-acetyltransferase